MKTKLLSLTILGYSLFLFSCDVFDNDVVPSNNVTTNQYAYSGYDGIDASNAFSVYVSFSDTEESIEIEANDNLHQYIRVKLENGTLVIEIEDNVSVRGNATLNAFITTNSVSDFEGSGAIRFIVEDPVNENDIMIDLSGASTFSGEFNTNNLYTDLSGASILDVRGYAENANMEASGASIIKNDGLVIDYLKTDLSGASNVTITVNEEIDVEASGASILRYKGDAVITYQDLSGASSIQKM